MTSQAPDILYLEGERRWMDQYPFDAYLVTLKERPKLASGGTGLVRGYVGTWEVTGGCLYLAKLDGLLEGNVPLTLDAYFPGNPGKVLAEWFIGEIWLPQGKIIRYQAFLPIYDE